MLKRLGGNTLALGCRYFSVQFECIFTNLSHFLAHIFSAINFGFKPIKISFDNSR